ncbi:MAG: hypothetical protein ACHQRM_16635 [Bacteroidia bacterium]
MTKYRFKTQIPQPTDEQIGRNKNFRTLKANYNRATQPLFRTPLYKNKKVFLALLLLAVIAWLISELIDTKNKPADPEHQSAPLPDKNKPLTD